MDKARLQKTSKVSRHTKDMKLDHSVIPVKRVLTVEDGLENPLTGVAIYLLRTSTKRTLGEETFQREIMCGMLNAQVKTFFQILAFISAIFLATNGRVRLIIFSTIFSYHLMPQRDSNPRQ